MNSDKKIDLTVEQISLLLQIINRGTYVGEQVEIVANLKQTLLLLLKQKQENIITFSGQM